MSFMKQEIESLREFVYEGNTKDISFRIGCLDKLKDTILKRHDEIVYALNEDLNKSEMESIITEIGFCLDEIEFTKENLESWASTKVVKSPEHLQYTKSSIKPGPKGACLIIGAYNLPFHLTIIPLIGVIAAGNSAIVKPSELAVKTSNVISKVISDTFSPNHVVCINGGKGVVKELLEYKLDHIVFTGSTSTGKAILKKASETLTPVTLELGGKSPCVVDQYVDLEVTAKKIAYGKFLNAGQLCNAPDYLLVHKEVKSELIDYLSQAILDMYGSDPAVSRDYARIINERHFSRITELIGGPGSEVILGGKTDRDSLYIEPTLINVERLNHSLLAEEIFGPLLPIIEFSELAEAEELINNIDPSPLALYVFTNRAEISDHLTTKIRFGGGCINECVVQISNPDLPFGGVGTSGMGSYHGEAGFLEFSDLKSIVETLSTSYSYEAYPPYIQ